MKKIEMARAKLIAKAKKEGLTENFGQEEVRKLKDKLKYNPYGTTEERQIAAAIDRFDNWCMNFDLSCIN